MVFKLAQQFMGVYRIVLDAQHASFNLCRMVRSFDAGEHKN